METVLVLVALALVVILVAVTRYVEASRRK
jgi:hypothetical protein